MKLENKKEFQEKVTIIGLFWFCKMPRNSYENNKKGELKVS